MTFILDILVFAVVAALVWIIALEVRFHSLKNIAAESRELANEAAADARNAINKITKRKS
jgi:Tfp pilus assembly protein PilO